MRKCMDEKRKREFLKAQRLELTEHLIYSKLAVVSKEAHNQKILFRMAKDELRHYKFWKGVTKKETKPNMFRVFWYVLIARFLGLSFGLKLMERGENTAIEVYSKLPQRKGVAAMIKDEQKHEKALLNMLSEQKLEYAGSFVLGLNDALVELSGALAGLTLALQNVKLIGIIGVITGFAASLSMAASGYLQSKEDGDKYPLKSAAYTGIAYIVTVAILVLPYFLLDELYPALLTMLALVLIIIFTYTFYVSVAKNKSFWSKFGEMAMLSLTVALISFGVGWLVRMWFGIEI
jgi:vacuolar iron transporter family protein